MKDRIQNRIVWFLLSVFLTPVAIKTIHIHEHHFVCTEKHASNLHKQAEKCDICDFTFSLFTPKSDTICCNIDSFIDCYNNSYISVFFTKSFFLNISLRAPPK